MHSSPTPCPTRPTRRRQPPRADANSPSRTLESYPPLWLEVIGHAKRAFRAYVAGQCGFPDPVSGTQEARECLEDALEVHKEEGGTVEPGQYTLHHMSSSLTSRIGYTITKDMAMLVRP